MFMREKPPEITKELIRSAIYYRNKIDLKKLNKILRSPYGEAEDGYDGLIVYSDEKTPKYYSLTAGSKEIKIIEIEMKDVEIGVCASLPTIIRKP